MVVGDFLVFLAFLFLLAVIVRQDFVFAILYLFIGAFFLGRWWTRKAATSVRHRREFVSRVFYNEEVPVNLEISNSSWFPVIWLQIRESLPVDLSIIKTFEQVLSIGPKGKVQFRYVLQARKRGYYSIGPFQAATDDPLGLFGEQRLQGTVDHLTVYPKIIPLSNLNLPSRSPLGTLRHPQPIFEDPARIFGKREYISGDSLRRVDWKATASSGHLQVKLYEPSIALDTAIFLNLNSQEYELKYLFDSTELAIIIAASIANWVISKKQAVGLITNGTDPGMAGNIEGDDSLKVFPRMRPLPPRKGRGNLMHILDVLARVQPVETLPFVDLLRQEFVNLSWGTTLILITAQANDALFDQLFQLRRAGLNAILILAGLAGYSREAQRRAEYFNFPYYPIRNENDLDMWRQ